MKIGVDYSSVILQKTGIGSFTARLVEAMRRQSNGVEFHLYQPKNARDLNTPQRIFWEAVLLPQKASKDRVDVLYSPGFSPPALGSFSKIVTVHDLIGLIYPGNVGAVSRFYWSRWLPHNIKKADRLVASSESTRRDIVRFLGIPEKRVTVVLPAASPSFRRLENQDFVKEVMARYNVRTPYFISVGTLEPRKNLLRLLRAFERLCAKPRDISLVIAGKPGGVQREIERFVAEKSLAERVKILGYVSDEELVAFYNAAVGFVMISLYEGFGLPALEAMSCGLTGVVSNNSSLPEVVGNTALQVNPEDVDAITEGLETLVRDSSFRVKLSACAHERSKTFSIEKTAGEMLKIFK